MGSSDVIKKILFFQLLTSGNISILRKDCRLIIQISIKIKFAIYLCLEDPPVHKKIPNL